ncbi:hypothetical protein GWK47_001305 [Chionoecetes opilio]|uniref:Uncharacterized protein n=1 Tax=Chionoecetes opilio TaxID=41210 RepID=A0A8J4XXN6_CHIOP|nr:hypothetical protein GWK47_001305 [Chionoecetes opilio]
MTYTNKFDDLAHPLGKGTLEHAYFIAPPSGYSCSYSVVCGGRRGGGGGVHRVSGSSILTQASPTLPPQSPLWCVEGYLRALYQSVVHVGYLAGVISSPHHADALEVFEAQAIVLWWVCCWGYTGVWVPWRGGTAFLIRSAMARTLPSPFPWSWCFLLYSEGFIALEELFIVIMLVYYSDALLGGQQLLTLFSIARNHICGHSLIITVSLARTLMMA